MVVEKTMSPSFFNLSAIIVGPRIFEREAISNRVFFSIGSMEGTTLLFPITPLSINRSLDKTAYEHPGNTPLDTCFSRYVLIIRHLYFSDLSLTFQHPYIGMNSFQHLLHCQHLPVCRL